MKLFITWQCHDFLLLYPDSCFFQRQKKVFRQLQSILKIIKRIKIYKSFFKNWQCQPKLFLRSFTAPLFLSAIWLAEKVHNGAKIKRMKTFFFHVAGKPWTDNWLPTPLGSFQHVRVTFSKLSWNTGTNTWSIVCAERNKQRTAQVDSQVGLKRGKLLIMVRNSFWWIYSAKNTQIWRIL